MSLRSEVATYRPNFWRCVSLACLSQIAWTYLHSQDSYSYSKTLPDKGRVWTVILRHVDGDTVQLGSIVDEGTVRLLDADAPEMEPRLNLTDAEKRDPVKLAARRAEIEAEKKLARASKARLAELLPVNSVWRTEIAGHDGFDRPLVRFFREDGKTINQQMIDEGHAKEYRR